MLNKQTSKKSDTSLKHTTKTTGFSYKDINTSIIYILRLVLSTQQIYQNNIKYHNHILNNLTSY